jgi:Mg-chelatase subunit ChlD
LIVFVLAVLALAQFAIRLPDRAGTVVVVADRSESMPKQSSAAEKEAIDLLHKSMRPHDQLGVVSFGRQAVVEQSPQHGEFGGFTAQVGSEHSDLNSALETALALVPSDGSGRILVLSDGKWTGKDPAAAAARAAGRGVPIDYRWLSRPQASDVAIQSFAAPDSVLPGQGYVVSGWVRSPGDMEIQYQLRRGNTIIASGSKQLSSGLNRLMFRDRAGEAGVYDYTLKVDGAKEDPVPENNEARALVSIEGSRPILLVSAAGKDSGLAKLLRRGGVDVIGAMPNECRWGLEDLAQYSAVMLENVPANQIGTAGMETLSAWVEDAGNGLLLTGGQKSYGPGGYFKSPLDRILPISMEMRREHRKLSLAIVIAMDRSGSMAMPAGGGKTKMDLADLGAVQVLDLLSPMDEFGVIAVDSSPHEIVPLNTVERNANERGTILSIDSMGGGIFIYEALSAAAGSIVKAKAETKHIILFADAADSEEPGNYVQLLDKCREGGVTVSVIGLGTERDSDANLLKDLAVRGGGTCYFTDSPEEIPRLFAQDTFTVARSTFVDQPTPFQLTAGFTALGSGFGGTPPSLGGYNLCYVRPEANLAAATEDEYKAPVVASWNAGNGRVLCFLGEADGKFSGEFAKWAQTGEFYSTLARWTAGKLQNLPSEELLTQQVRDGVCLVQLHLDPERKTDPFAALPRVKVLHGIPGTPPTKQTLAMQWKSADLLEAAIPIAGRETVLNTVEIPGEQPVMLSPVCLPYSPEFAPDQPGRGSATLAQIAATSGGKERIEIPQLWADLKTKPRYVEMSPWLFVIAALLFLLEVFERRTGWFSRLGRAPATAVAEGSETPESIQTGRAPFWKRSQRLKTSKGKPKAQPKTAVVVAENKRPSELNAASDSNLDALKQARERASRRTNRDS